MDPSGNTVLFRGLAISDADKLEMQGHWNKQHFVKVQEMGAKLVRIPVHPVAWRERTPAEYIKLLDQAVGWCTELDMYVIVDWHSIGNLETEVFQEFDVRHHQGRRPLLFGERWPGTSPAITQWRFSSFSTSQPHFATSSARSLGLIGREPWRKEITLIRANDPQVIPLVAGFDWAYDSHAADSQPDRRWGRRL